VIGAAEIVLAARVGGRQFLTAYRRRQSAQLGKMERWKDGSPQAGAVEAPPVGMHRGIEELYFKRFGKTVPDTVMSIEDRARLDQQKKERADTLGGDRKSP
jgi:hypothetical protein